MASEDTYAVQDYLLSRDAAHYMMANQDIKAVFNRPEGDWLARFPNVLTGPSFEFFYHYYQNHISAELDTTTSISTLKVRTFRPDDSQRVAQALIVAAERLVNRMNQRQRENMISSAAREVDDAEARLRAIAAQMADYRNREALLDPMKQSVPMMKGISDLQSMLTTTRLQLAQLQRSAPNSPLIPVYQRRATALEAQIAQSGKEITGPSNSLVPKITAFEDLTLQRELAEKQLTIAATTLSAAKQQADRQQLYLEEISKPDLPDYPTYPHRIIDVLIVFASCLGIYLMGKLIISGAREHQVA